MSTRPTTPSGPRQRDSIPGRSTSYGTYLLGRQTRPAPGCDPVGLTAVTALDLLVAVLHHLAAVLIIAGSHRPSWMSRNRPTPRTQQAGEVPALPSTGGLTRERPRDLPDFSACPRLSSTGPAGPAAPHGSGRGTTARSVSGQSFTGRAVVPAASRWQHPGPPRPGGISRRARSPRRAPYPRRPRSAPPS